MGADFLLGACAPRILARVGKPALNMACPIWMSARHFTIATVRSLLPMTLCAAGSISVCSGIIQAIA